MKKITTIALAFVLVIGIASCGNSQNQSNEVKAASGKQSATIAKNINTTEFQQMMQSKKDVVVLDVRTPEEVAAGAIAGSTHLDIYDPKFKETLEEMDKNKPMMVYCAVGGRSGQAMQIMKKMGFKEVYNLSGGIRAWKSDGKPVK